MHEKEQVYQELERTRRKCARLREQVKGLNEVLSQSQIVQTRQERVRLKKALSWIGHSPHAPDDAEALKYAARLALLGKAYTIEQRKRNRAVAANGACCPECGSRRDQVGV